MRWDASWTCAARWRRRRTRGPRASLLPVEAWDRLREDWSDEDIEDALGLVRDSLLQGELVEAADSLSARLVELLGTWGDAERVGRGRPRPRETSRST